MFPRVQKKSGHVVPQPIRARAFRCGKYLAKVTNLAKKIASHQLVLFRCPSYYRQGKHIVECNVFVTDLVSIRSVITTVTNFN